MVNNCVKALQEHNRPEVLKARKKDTDNVPSTNISLIICWKKITLFGYLNMTAHKIWQPLCQISQLSSHRKEKGTPNTTQRPSVTIKCLSLIEWPCKVIAFHFSESFNVFAWIKLISLLWISFSTFNANFLFEVVQVLDNWYKLWQKDDKWVPGEVVKKYSSVLISLTVTL